MFDSIVGAVKYYADHRPESLCLVDDKLVLTYKGYYEYIVKLAQLLELQGIKAGDRVVLEANQSVCYLGLELALHLLQAIFVPLEHNCGVKQLEEIAVSCSAAMVIANNPPEGDFKSLTYKNLEEQVEGMDITKAYSLPGPSVVSEILFSTGTTGKKKGIVLTHSSDVAVAENIAQAVGLEGTNIEMIPSPLNHSHGLRSYYANMINGAAVIVISSLMDMRRFFRLMDEYQVTAIDLVPSALTVVLKLSKSKLKDYREQLRYIEFGSSAMAAGDKAKICELLPQTPLYNFYGSTESGRVTVYNFNRPDCKERCIGKPTCNVNLQVVNEQRKPIVSSKEHIGLLATAGGMNMVGYWQDEAETSSVLQNGFVYSNDEAYVDEDGDIILLGRKGDVINVGGRKVSPEEVENVVKKLAYIEDCACIGIKNELLGSVPKLFVQLKPGQSLDAVAIKKFIGENLESYKVPQVIEVIVKIPRSYNGKVLRKELH